LKKIILFSLSISFCFFGFSQNALIDNIKNHLETKNPTDSIKVKAYYSLAQAYSSFSNDSFILYTNKALKSSLKTNNYLLPEIYNYKGIEYIMKAKPDSARIYLNKALSVLDEENDIEVKANVYQNFSNSYQSKGNFQKRVDYLIKSADMLQNNPYNQCVSLFNIGAVYNQMDIKSKSLDYFKKSYEISKIGKNVTMESASLTAIGTAYLGSKELDSAEVYLEKSLVISKQTNSSRDLYDTYSKLGGLYSKKKLYDKAEDAYLRASKHAELLGDEKNIMRVNASLADYYFDKKKYKKAIDYYKEYYRLYEENPDKDLNLIHLIYKNWGRAEGASGNTRKSNELLDKYLKIQDSLYSKENRALVADLETKYQTEKKDKTILENELKLEKSQTKTRLMTILIISLLLASILLWFVFQQRQKRIEQQLVAIQKEQEIQTLESLIEGEEKERLRIAKELHDGVNGDLSAIKFKLSSLLKMNNEVINEAVTMIDNSCQQVRAISHNLVPPSLKNFSLVEAVSNYCENMDSIHKPEISFQTIGDAIDLNKKVEVNIFRIIQELVTNATKHAQASAIDVQISHQNNSILVTVEDNGKGYDSEVEAHSGIGLENIKSRVEYLNANLEVVTSENGTSNTLEIDVDKISTK